MINKNKNKSIFSLGGKSSSGNKLFLGNVNSNISNKINKNINSNINSKNKKKNIDLRIKPIGIRLKAKPSVKPRSYKYSLKRRIRSPGYEVAGIRKMNWQQLKKRLPGLSPTADADFDGSINSRDCRPLDPSKDGVFGRILGVVTGGRAGQSKEEYQAEKAEKRERKAEAKQERMEAKQERREAKEIPERRVERVKEQVRQAPMREKSPQELMAETLRAAKKESKRITR